MALIDVRCTNEHFSEVYRAAADWPKTPPCPECGAETEQMHLPKKVTWNPDPVIVFRAPDGSYRYPGDANGISAAVYRKQGLEEVQIRSAAEMRRFEGQVAKQDRADAERQNEAMARKREHAESLRRSHLRDEMRSMSDFGKNVARAAMARGDQKPRRYAHESGFHSQVYSTDRSNREESRDPQGRRRRD